MNYRIFLSLLLAVALTLPQGCGSSDNDNGTPDPNDSATLANTPVKGDYVRIHSSSDPDNLNPYNSTHAASTYIKEQMYQYLEQVNPLTQKMEPCLATALAVVSPDKLRFTFEMRKEARWDNGDPITGKDFEFSIKTIKNPKTDCPHVRGYYNFVSDVIVDEANPRKFTVVINEPYFLAELSISGIELIHKNFYDPKGLMDKFSIQDLDTKGEQLLTDPDILAFAEHFNSEKFSRDPAFMSGSGPYRLEEWVTGQRVVLVRKENWWADGMGDQCWAFENYPEKLIFKTITDRNTAVTALKSGELDVMRDIPGQFFQEFKKGGMVADNYNLFTPDMYAFTYIAMNAKPPVGYNKYFTDKRVRRAMAHIVDVNNLIENVYYGYGVRLIGPISPMREDEYNKNLKPILQDLKKAAELLDEAGWKDSNHNGVRDKMIDGVRVEFEPKFYYSNASTTGPRVALHMQQEAEKVGVKIIPQVFNTTVLSGKMKKHEFDLYGMGSIGSPFPTDLKQVWHTSEWASGGSNYFGFGNPHTDSLIEYIRLELDPVKRQPMYNEFQEICYDEQPLIFMISPKEKIAIHKRFRNAEVSVVRPGFKANRFWVPKAEQKF